MLSRFKNKITLIATLLNFSLLHAMQQPNTSSPFDTFYRFNRDIYALKQDTRGIMLTMLKKNIELCKTKIESLGAMYDEAAPGISKDLALFKVYRIQAKKNLLDCEFSSVHGATLEAKGFYEKFLKIRTKASVLYNKELEDQSLGLWLKRLEQGSAIDLCLESDRTLLTLVTQEDPATFWTEWNPELWTEELKA